MFEKLKTALIELSKGTGLLESEVKIAVKGLTPKEAIGVTERKDFPLLHGKECLIQANFRNALGQAFTDSPGNFKGRIKEILGLELTDNGERALFIATLNAVMRYLGTADKTIHCKNESPELCAKEIVRSIIDKYGANANVGIIGFQPAIIDNFSKSISSQNIKVTDLDQENIGKVKYGVPVWDGRKMEEELFKTCDVVLATGSTIVNDTLGQLTDLSGRYCKPLYFYGTTIAGPAKVLNLARLCFQAS